MISKKRIAEIIKARDIRYLMHFTPINNLDSILEKGFYSRQDIENDIINAFCTDNYRLDGYKEGISLSISFPNSYMLDYKKRNTNLVWCIVILDARVMIDLDCAFFYTNAASGILKNYSFDYAKTDKGLENMFYTKIERKYREYVIREHYLKEKDPTYEQAEVMVFEHIPNKYIIGCAFEDYETVKDKYAKNYPYLVFKNFKKNEGLFDSRANARASGFNDY